MKPHSLCVKERKACSCTAKQVRRNQGPVVLFIVLARRGAGFRPSICIDFQSFGEAHAIFERHAIERGVNRVFDDLNRLAFALRIHGKLTLRICPLTLDYRAPMRDIMAANGEQFKRMAIHASFSSSARPLKRRCTAIACEGRSSRWKAPLNSS